MLAGGGEDVAAACDNNRYSLDRRRLSQKGKGKKGTMAALLLVLATALWSCPVGAASPPIEGEGRVCPVVASGPNYPVLDVNLPGLWANLSGGFENGAVVKVDGVYHMITTGWSAGTYSHDIVVQFSSPNKYNWTFGGQVAGCRWENGQWWNPVAQPALYFSNDTDRWELFHIWCIENKVGWTPNCTCVRMASTTPGYSGITGPWAEDGVVLAPEPGSQPWESGTLDSISNPFLVGDRYYVFIGGGGSCGWCVGLASAQNMSGPFVRVPNGTAVALINGKDSTGRQYNENPLVLRLPTGVFVSVFDFLQPEVTLGHDGVFGFSYSTNGVDWPAENGASVPLLRAPDETLWTNRARTPLSLVDEGDGSYTMFYTGFKGAAAGVSFVTLTFHTVPVPPPAPPAPPGPHFIPWVRAPGISGAHCATYSPDA